MQIPQVTRTCCMQLVQITSGGGGGGTETGTVPKFSP